MNYIINLTRLAAAALVVSTPFFSLRRKPMVFETPERAVVVEYRSSHCGDYYGTDYMQCRALEEGRVGGMWTHLGLGLSEVSIHHSNFGPLYFTHGFPGQYHEVPAGHKLVTCYCDQPECLVRNPAGPLLVQPVDNNSVLNVSITIMPTVEE